MKKIFFFLVIVSLSMAFDSCESCECGCEGDVNIINNSGVSYSFEIKKGSTVIFKGTLSGIDDVWFGLEKGSFTLKYSYQAVSHSKNFNIVDCETTTLNI